VIEKTGAQGGPEGERLPRRDEVMDALCEAYAQDELELDELERRLDRATRATTGTELMALLRDLDRRNLPAALGGSGTRPVPSGRPGGREGDAGALEVPAPPGRAHPARVPDRQFEVAVFSGRVRKGSWIPGRRITAAALMGGVELDFREAMFGTGVTEVHVVAFMGGVEIVVPPGIHLETSGFAILGGFDEDSDVGETPGPDAPTLRVRGMACLGGVDVSVRYPGESPRDARRRRKEERRQRRKGGS
jgi:hypothetical protein